MHFGMGVFYNYNELFEEKMTNLVKFLIIPVIILILTVLTSGILKEILNGILALLIFSAMCIIAGYSLYILVTGGSGTITLVDSLGEDILVDYERLGWKFFFYDEIYEFQMISERKVFPTAWMKYVIHQKKK